eukprot:54635_1
MPRIVNGVIQKSEKKKAYERIDENDVENPLTKCCKCNSNTCNSNTCNLNCVDCSVCNKYCICSCGSCIFMPAMLLSVDAIIGYLILITCGLVSYFAGWKIGLIIFVICIIGYVFAIYYRCCGANGNEIRNRYNINAANRDRDINRNKYKKSSNNPNRKTGIMGIDDLPKTKKGG